MFKSFIIILAFIFLIGLTSATTIYAGDCLDVNLSELKSLDNVIYDVVGNSSNLDGLTIDLNKTTAIANICTVLNYKSDSFTLIFFDVKTEEVIKEVHVGGGGTNTIIKNQTIEIPVYIDGEVNETNEIINVDPITKNKLNYSYFLIALGLVVLLSIILSLLNKRNKDINERRFKNEQ